jgi:uncharacterized protein (UPF0332 family)
MFYLTQAVLLTKNLAFSSHRGVITMFGEHFIKTGVFSKELGRELNRAFAKRQIGDYTHAFAISEEESQQVLENGQRFVAELAHYLKENKNL